MSSATSTDGIGKMRQRLNEILAAHARKRVNGDVASHSTTTTLGQTLHTTFSDLWNLSFRITNPENLNQNHIASLCRHWYEKELAISTIHARLSALRIFSGWIGKTGTVKSLPEYLPEIDKARLRVRKVALQSKSWTENGIDVMQKIREADRLDAVFGQMLRMTLAFGLRRMEVIQFKPHKSDKGTYIQIFEAKNGRQRVIDIETPEQRQVLDAVKAAHKSKTDHIGWKHTTRGKQADLAYSIGRYNKCMAAIGITREDAGVTGHGLRAQYAENAALIAQMIPPTLGGTAGQMPRDDLNVKREQVSEKLGHSRISITKSYYGSFGRDTTPDVADRCKRNIEDALQHCHAGVTKAVPAERLSDCVKLVTEMAGIDVDMTVKQAQLLWEIHSLRFGRTWVEPLEGNAASMEVAAIKLLRQCGTP